MKSWIIFGILGYLFGGPYLAVAGAALGYIFGDRKRASARFRSDPQYAKALIEFTYELMGYVARSAGRVNEEHIAIANHYMRMMQLDDGMKALAREAFNRGRSAGFDIDSCIGSYSSVIGFNSELVCYLLEIQIQVALSDGILSQSERECLIAVAVKLGISAQSMAALIDRRYQEMAFKNGGFSGSSDSYGSSDESGSYRNSSDDRSYSSYRSTDASRLEAAYALLGVSADVSDAELKKAHKRMMLKYHPDRLASQGLTEDMIKVYTEKAKAIQSAFDLIKKERGIR